ncbi:MAG: hypothetical protein ACI8S3_001639, partial [Alphaproteobacteria bacterium]
PVTPLSKLGAIIATVIKTASKRGKRTVRLGTICDRRINPNEDVVAVRR